ncbi:hypothetical protein NVP1055O_01, partial [Vibrio phage 1.055.O._10N.286.55.E9]
YRKLQRNIINKYWSVESDKVDRICRKLNKKIYGHLNVNEKIKDGVAGQQYLCE